MNWNHFKGKNAFQHLKEARKKGSKATTEMHGTEAPGYFAAAADTIKDSALIYLSFYLLLIFFEVSSPLFFLIFFSISFLIWKAGRSALLGWARLERLHRLIEQERWEIEHHHAQEKEELAAMYVQKGFSSPLLDQVVDVLSADDNRLLQVMLEEELGLTLESYEHPLKQALGAFFGGLIVISGTLFFAWIGKTIGVVLFLLFLFLSATLIFAKREGNELIKALVWNFAIGTLAILALYFMTRWAL